MTSTCGWVFSAPEDEFALYIAETESQLSPPWAVGDWMVADASPQVPVQFSHMTLSGLVQTCWSGPLVPQLSP